MGSALWAGPYDALSRFRLLDDRFKTDGHLFPIKHDFFIGISGLFNTDLQDKVKDLFDLSRQNDPPDDIQGQIQEIQKFLKKYNDTETFLRTSLRAGIPLPSFRIRRITFRPHLNILASGGGILHMREDILDSRNVASYVGSEIPEVLKQKLVDNWERINTGDDIVDWILTNDSTSIPEEYRANLRARFVGKYFMPDRETSSLETYLDLETKVGFFIDYEISKRWDGELNIYSLGRSDFRLKADAQTIVNNREVIKFPKHMNTTSYISADYVFRYTNRDLRLALSVEELRLFNTSDNEAKGGKLVRNTHPLFRFHGSYRDRWRFLYFSYFLGVHQRKDYTMREGYYIGGTLWMPLWRDRILPVFLGKIDSEYITIAPSFNMGPMRMSYSLMTPLKSTLNGLTLSNLHSVDIRFVF